MAYISWHGGNSIAMFLYLPPSLLHAANMPGIEFHLNENPPESEVDQNIDRDSIAELEADVADGLQDFYPASVLKSFRFQISVGSLQVSVNCW